LMIFPILSLTSFVICVVFFLLRSVAHRVLHSPPTRRSSDLRFVQIWSGNDNGFPRRNWDSHEDVKRDHGPLALGMARGAAVALRSEEHTSELQSLTNLVCRLLFENKNISGLFSSCWTYGSCC